MVFIEDSGHTWLHLCLLHTNKYQNGRSRDLRTSQWHQNAGLCLHCTDFKCTQICTEKQNVKILHSYRNPALYQYQFWTVSQGLKFSCLTLIWKAPKYMPYFTKKMSIISCLISHKRTNFSPNNHFEHFDEIWNFSLQLAHTKDWSDTFTNHKDECYYSKPNQFDTFHQYSPKVQFNQLGTKYSYSPQIWTFLTSCT